MAEVAKVLRGGAAGIALSLAVDQLLDGVDWVLDPANNRIVYQKPDKPLSHLQYVWLFGNKYASTLQGACDLMTAHYNATGPKYKFERYEEVISGYIAYCYYSSLEYPDLRNWDFRNPVNTVVNPYYDPNTLSLKTIAEQVISNADAGSVDAQFATYAAAQNILNEAYNDDAKAEPIVNELENNADDKCSKHNAYQNGQARIIEDRYNEMFVDFFDLYNKYRSINNPLRGIGSWEGHIYFYVEIEQPELRDRILKAFFDGCHETSSAQRWKAKAPPPKPGVHSPN